MFLKCSRAILNMGENTVIKSSMVKTPRVDSKLNSGYVKKKKSKLELT